MNLPPSLRRRLVALAHALRLLRAARGLAAWVALCAVAVASAVLVLRFVAPTPLFHAWLVRGLWALALGGLAMLLLRPLLSPARVVTAGREVERRFPDLQDRLLALIDPAATQEGVASTALAGALSQQVEGRLSDERLSAALNLSTLRRSGTIALTALLVAALVFATCPQGVARLLSPPTVEQH